jgi:hypothetical protein
MLAAAADVRSAIPNGASLDTAVVNSLLAAADAAAKSYMRRTLESGSYAERIPAARVGVSMFVVEYPVTAVTSLNVAQSCAMSVWNTGAARATVSVKETGLLLREFYSGAWIETTLAFSSYATLTLLATAIAAISGSRWDAELSSEVIGTEPSDELCSLVGPIDIAGSKPTMLYLMDGVPLTDWNYKAGSFKFTEVGAKEGETVLVRYTGGYSSIPPDVTKAVAMIAAEMYAEDNASVSRGMKREKLGNYEGERFEGQAAVLSPAVCKLLAPWRRVLA